MDSPERYVTLAVPENLVRKLTRHALFTPPARRSRSRIAWFDTDRFDLCERNISLCLIDAGTARIQRVARGTEDEYLAAYGPDFDFSSVPEDDLRRRLRRAVRRGLAPVFETQAIVSSWQLALEGGKAVLAQLARGELRSGERVLRISELRLSSVDAQDCSHYRVARDLIADLRLRVEPAALEVRGLRLARNQTPQPVKSSPSPVSPKHSSADALRAIARACVAQFQFNEAGASGSNDPEYVHQMRVSMRRLRSALRAFAPVLPAEVQTRFVPGLRTLAAALGAARDWDVTLEELILPVAQTQPEDARLATLVAAATQLREEARAQCAAALAVGSHHLLLAELLVYLHCDWPAATAEEQPLLGQFAARRLDALHRKVAKAAKRVSADDIPALHRLRIAIKRLRYTLEFFAPLFSRKAVRAYLGRMEKLQEDLGLLNDLANAYPRLADCAVRNPAMAEGVAFAHGWYATRLAELLQRIPGEVRPLAKQKRFWMG